MAGRALTLLFALLPAAASAYSNTHPVIAWSSHEYVDHTQLPASRLSLPRSKALSAPAVSEAARTGSHAIAHALYSHDDICSHDAVVVVDHSGVSRSFHVPSRAD